VRRAESGAELSRRVALLGAAGLIPSIVSVATPSPRAHAVQVPATTTLRTDADARTLQDAIDGTPAHGVLSVTRDWQTSVSVVVDHPMTIRFDGGALRTDRDVDLLLVRSGDVQLVDVVLRGSGAGHSGLGRGVHAAGTVDVPLAGVHVVGADIVGFPHDGVLFEHCSEFVVADSHIRDVGYAGVLLFSCVDGSVSRNVIERVTQPAPYTNSYGIEAVRATTSGLDRAPRSARITVSDNHVSDVPNWEGIDTHGGEGISIVRNRVEGCRVGIALVPSKDEDDPATTKYAPIACAVVDNVVVRTFPGPGSGIVVRGAGETIGPPAERATGLVLRNEVRGYGDGDRDASILLYLTADFLVAQNRCVDGVRRGISLYHSNDDVIIAANVVRGLRRQGTATSVAIDVRATENTGTLLDNRHEHDGGARDAYGLMCRSAANRMVLVGNDWGAVTTPVSAHLDAVVRYDNG
jgi:hypothetical protein